MLEGSVDADRRRDEEAHAAPVAFRAAPGAPNAITLVSLAGAAAGTAPLPRALDADAPIAAPSTPWTFSPETIAGAGYPFALPARAAEIDALLAAGDADAPSDTPNPQPSGGAGATDLFDAAAIARGDSALGALDDDERAYLLDRTAADWATSDRPDRQADLDALAASLEDDPELRAEFLDAFARTSVTATTEGRHRDVANLAAGFVTMTSDAEELRGALEALPVEEAISLTTAIAYEDSTNPDDRAPLQRRVVEAVASGAPTEASTEVLNAAFLTMDPDAVRGAEGAMAEALAQHWYPDDADAAADVAARVEDVLETEQGRAFLFNQDVSPVERLDNLRRLHDHEDWDAERFTSTASVYDNSALLFDAARPVLDDFAARTDGPQVLAGTDLENTIGAAMNETVWLSPTATEAELAAREGAVAEGEASLYAALPALTPEQFAEMTPAEVEAYEATREASQATADRVDDVADAVRAIEDDPESGVDEAAITVLPIQYSHESIGTVTYPLFRVEDADDPTAVRFVDHQGRTYDDFDDWRNTNALQPGSMVWPEGGQLDGRLVRGNTPSTADTPAERALQVVDTAALVGGTIAGGVVIVGTGGLAVAVALGVVATSGAWQGARGAQALIDRAEHGQNWTDLSDPSVRSSWLAIGAGASTTLALGATAVARPLAAPIAAGAEGSRLAVPAAAAQRFFGLSAAAIDTAAAGDAALTLAANFDELSGADRLALIGQIGFWGAGAIAARPGAAADGARPFDVDTHVRPDGPLPVFDEPYPPVPLPDDVYPQAGDHATAQHLPPNVPGYNEVQVGPQQRAFLEQMGAAIDRAVVRLGGLEGPVDGAGVRAVFDDITNTRFEIAQSVGDDPSLFVLDASSAIAIDYIRPDGRHQFYFDRALALPEDSAVLGRPLRGSTENSIVIDGREVPLATVIRDSNGNFQVHHPPFSEVIGDPSYDPALAPEQHRQVSDHAFDLYAEVLNDPTLTLDEGLERIAEASFLLYHYTPNVRGTPAVVSSLNDAVLRERFGVTFPPLRPNTEPFWEAIFAGADGMDTFIQDFPGYYESFGG